MSASPAPLRALVSTEVLAANLGAGWRLFDCRHDLMKPDWGAAQYAEAHLPGALFAHMDRDLSAEKTGRNGRHPLPDCGAFVAWLGQQGLRRTDTVVCYDESNGVMAARLWWMLRSIGHASVAVLDGGIAKWRREGRPLTAEVPRVTHSPYPAGAWSAANIDAQTVLAELGRATLVDARAPFRWRGEKEPVDPVAGRIPGAKNRFSNDNVGADGTFKPAAEIRREFEAVFGATRPQDVIHYCGSGVSACHNLLALEHAGLGTGRLYCGSWSEWSSDPSRPQERG